MPGSRRIEVMQTAVRHDQRPAGMGATQLAHQREQFIECQILDPDHQQEHMGLALGRVQLIEWRLHRAVGQPAGVEKAQQRTLLGKGIEARMRSEGLKAIADLIARLPGQFGDDAGLAGLGFAQQPDNRRLGLDPGGDTLERSSRHDQRTRAALRT
ncbi:hypothetical protein Thiosp_04618 [Thiorhodovibrio litoralis]|nr:hypothetical protein Thiosp_04618 [Thiorhodovibrio litoralis]